MKDRYEEPPTQWIFSSGALGSGLAILSRFPIVSTSYSRYTLAGRPLKIFHGDFYVGKGFASACIDHPDIGIIEVFNTHVSSSSVRIIMEEWLLIFDYLVACRIWWWNWIWRSPIIRDMGIGTSITCISCSRPSSDCGTIKDYCI